MNDKNAKLLERIVNERAKRLGVSRRDVLGNMTKKPQFLSAAEEHATFELTGTPASILRQDLDRLATSEYPGPECIMPYEIEEFQESGLHGLTADRINHIQDCFCCTIL